MSSQPRREAKLSLKSYVVGFVGSLIFTLAAYLLVTHNLLSRRVLIATIAVLALAQFLTQLLLFLHLGRETRPRWKLMVFAFMVMVVAILVFGSLWIMYRLNYHMSQHQMYEYLNNQSDGI